MKKKVQNNSWQIILLGKIADFQNGINYNKNNFGKGIKIINVRDFQDNSVVDLNNLDEINPKGIIRGGNILQNDDILFVRSNGNRDLILSIR